MGRARAVPVANLKLDLANYRTVKQRSESRAVEAMIATSPDRFWALAISLLDDGFLPTENIIVLSTGTKKPELVVREGNRRIGAMKLILGEITVDSAAVPSDILGRIADLDDGWRKANASVPCVVYEPKDDALVDKIVTLAHGKGEKAGRDQWNTVARARHNRDANRASEPGLDLLEKYLNQGKNVTPEQAARWSGDYPLTVLDEAIKRLAPRLGLKSAPEVSKAYPKVQHLVALESVIHAIGQKLLGFHEIRSAAKDFGEAHGLPSSAGTGASSGSGSTGGEGSRGGGTQGGAKAGTKSGPSSRGKTKSVSGTDPQSVKRLLRGWSPKGKGREKVVALRNEARSLNLSKTPLAFCFVLRSMFEISAKAYCADHAGDGGPSLTKKNGDNKPLASVLREVTKHLTGNSSDKDAVKRLHGAMAELGRTDGFLSVTSMNQLVHNPSFSIGTTDVCVLFGNIFPLLEAMNE